MTIQWDERWSCVGTKANTQWVGLALDAETRLIGGWFVGARDATGAQGLWRSLPPVYRQCAVCYTDCWRAYAAILPSKRHVATDKRSGQTNLSERFNTTLRQRCARLVRKTLSCSKKLENHIGAIWYFIHDYNAYQIQRLSTTSA